MIGQEADRMRVKACLVGGSVRDLLLGLKNYDLDILMECDAIEFAKRISRKCKTNLTVYPHFGTATLTWEEGRKIDLTSSRKEIYHRPGSLPTVSPGSIKEDLFRRDFTINAMAVFLNQRFFGKLIDYSESEEDLRNKIIRVFHNKSFVDDPTRILRAIRFEQRLGFRIESKTRKLLIDAIDKELYLNVTPGRYFEEFKKLLEEKKFKACLKRLIKFNGLGFLNRSGKFQGINQILLNSVYQNNLWVDSKIQKNQDFKQWLLVLMTIVDSFGSEKIKEIGKKFLISQKDQQRIFRSGQSSDYIKNLANQNMSPSMVYQILSPLSLEEIIFLMSKAYNKTVLNNIKNYLLKYKNVRIYTTGRNLISRGWSSGIHMRKALEILLYQKIDGFLLTKEDEENMLIQMENARSCHAED